MSESNHRAGPYPHGRERICRDRRRVLARLALLAVLAVVGPARPSAAQSPPDLAGTWEGAVTVGGGQQVRILFHFRTELGAWSVTWDSPDQGATGLPAGPVTVDGSSVSIDLSVIQGGFDAELAPDGESMSGTFRQGPASIPLRVERTERTVTPLERPQHPSPPFPYRAEEVGFVNVAGGGHRLAGTLTLPEGAGPFTAAILISGSGPQDRDETLQGHKPFLVIADHLTRAGVAVLRYDDRGIGASEGNFAAATSADFATDVQAAMDFLASRPEIDARRVGLIGHSEGGLIAPMVAVERDDVAFLVLLAAPGLPGDEILLMQGALIAEAGGADEAAIRDSQSIQREIFAILKGAPDPAAVRDQVRAVLTRAAGRLTPRQRQSSGLTGAGIESQVAQVTSPWFHFFLRYDPRTPLRRVTAPVLALGGQRDLQVPPRENLREIATALRQAGNTDVTTTELRRLNHLFQTSVSGAPSEYGGITETFAPEALERISEWIRARFQG